MRPRILAALLALTAPLAADAANPVVRFTTVLGSYDVELCQELSAACAGVAPNTVANFLRYVDEGRYEPTGFIHRRGVGTSPAVIQGGGYWVDDPTVLMATNPFPPIALEPPVGLSNLRGTIAMAREQGLDSARSQWFVNLVDNTGLDTAGGGYAVFGNVVAGLDVVDALGAVPVYDDFCTIVTMHLCELPLIDWTGATTEFPFENLVYVPSIERVPEPASALGALAAVAALGALARRGARSA